MSISDLEREFNLAQALASATEAYNALVAGYEMQAYIAGFNAFERHTGQIIEDVDSLNPYLSSAPGNLRGAWFEGWSHARQAESIERESAQ